MVEWPRRVETLLRQTTTLVFLILEWEIVAGVAVHSPGIPMIGQVLPGPALLMVQLKGAKLAGVHPVLPRVGADDVLTQAGQVKR